MKYQLQDGLGFKMLFQKSLKIIFMFLIRKKMKKKILHAKISMIMKVGIKIN